MIVQGRQELLKSLQKMTERMLVERVILPFLEKNDFDSIEVRHGPYEKGVDILCIKKDELDELDLIAIQVKKLKFSGSATDPGHLHGVFNQLSQCIEEPVKLQDGTERSPARIWLVSPYPMGVSALETGFRKLVGAKASRIQIIDGNKLLSLVYKKAPEVLASLGDKYALYLMRVENELTFVHESSAFQLKDKIALLPIYVNLDVSVLPPQVIAILNKEITPSEYKSLCLEQADAQSQQEFLEEIETWAKFGQRSLEVIGVNPIRRLKLPKGRRAMMSEHYLDDRSLEDLEKAPLPKNILASLRSIKGQRIRGQKKFLRTIKTLVEPHQPGNYESLANYESMILNYTQRGRLKATLDIDGAVLCEGINHRTDEQIANLRGNLAASPKAGGAALAGFHHYAHQLEELMQHKSTRSMLGTQSSTSRQNLEFDRINIGIEELLESRLNFQVVGSAGAGKTTLLRIIGYKEACNRTERLPVFIPLSTMTSRTTLLGLIDKSCKSFGLSETKKSFLQLLEEGRLLLLLDGIDEAITRVKDVNAEITRFIRTYRSVQCIFTTRQWSALNRNPDFFTIQLLSFTREQVRTFFTKWFAHNPSHGREVIRHLNKNPGLYEIISTPLIATVFAVVKLFGGKLPTTLLELYEERLRLLLHAWDSAKGVKRDRFGEADKRFFLRKLAFYMHSKGIRGTSWESIVKLIHQIVGEIKTPQAAQEFARELVEFNNVLFQDSDGNWGFGHLQYQEYLAALEAKENPRINLADFLLDGWWSSVISMYAEMTRDISSLISDVFTAIREYELQKASTSEDLDWLDRREDLFVALHSLIPLAPNTEPRTKALFEKEMDLMKVVNYSFSKYSDEDIWHGKGLPR